MGDQIHDFWETHPCGAELVGDLSDETRAEYTAFFRRYDEYRYSKEPHILRNIDAVEWQGKRVLEIGLGQGADAERIIRAGAVYNGIDLTIESVKRVRMRLSLKELEYESLEQASALEIPFPAEAFDIVFSHGVLHHIPQIKEAQAEIARVLRPDGKLIVMLYAKWSLNYLLSIRLLRRVGLLGMHMLGLRGSGIYRAHLENAQKVGIRNYLAMPDFLNVSTDGPYNPYSKVYGRREIIEDFPDFELLAVHKEFMHAPPLTVGWLPFAGLLGWHLWAELKPRK